MKLVHHIFALLFILIVVCHGFAKTSIIIDRIDCIKHPDYSVYFHLERDSGGLLDRLDANDMRIIDNKTYIGSIKKLSHLPVEDSTGIVLIDMRGNISKKQTMEAIHVVQQILNKSRHIRKVSWFVLNRDGCESIDPKEFSLKQRVVASHQRRDGELRIGLFDAINSIQSQIVIAKKKNKVLFLFTRDGAEKGFTSLEEIKKQLSTNRIKVILLHAAKKRSDKALIDLVHHSGGSVVDMPHWRKSFNAFETVGNNYCIEYRSNVVDNQAPNEIELQFTRDAHLISAFSIVHKKKSNVMLPETINRELMVFLLIGIGGLVLIFILGFIYSEIRSVKKIASKQYASHGDDAPNRVFGKILNDVPQEPMSQVLDSGNDEIHSAWLILKKEGMSISKSPIFGAELIIGRGKECGLIIDEDSLSKNHAKIKSQLGKYFLYDLVSDQGTYLNGKKLIRPKQLHDWDEIRLGETILIFRGYST